MSKSVFTPAYQVLLEELIAARREQQVTQVELAHRLGKPQQWVSSVETGVRRIDLIELFAIARALSVDGVALVSRIEKRLPATFGI